MEVYYYLKDFYDWDPIDPEPVGLLTQPELYMLHYAGMAKNFEVKSYLHYTVTWKKGQKINSGAKITRDPNTI